MSTPDYVAYLREHGAERAVAEQLSAQDDLNLHGVDAALAVPMLRGSEAVGVLRFVRRGDGEAFTEREIALAETFADQAAIAVENARLFQSIQERNRDLTEALEQQTATADVLSIISQAPADLDRVLNALVMNAARLCDADVASIFRRDGQTTRADAVFSRDPGQPLIAEARPPLSRRTIVGRAILDAATIADFGSPEDRRREFPDGAGTRAEGIIARVALPLLREGNAIGALFVRRRQERPFGDREIALLRTFADQAVIAIDNARLFDELQTRNREQAEALEREQATAEVLRVISRSPEDLDASLQAVADTAAKLCRADFTRISLLDGEYLAEGPMGLPPTGGIAAPLSHRHLERLGPIAEVLLPSAEAARTGRTVHTDDLRRYVEEHNAPEGLGERLASSLAATGPRATLAVPLLRGSGVVGTLALSRHGGQRAFTAPEIALAETFADQAAIAVENARLFRGIQERNRDLTEALEQQTATADVLRIISEAPADLDRVLNALIANAARLCDGDTCAIWRVEGDALCIGAHIGAMPRDSAQDTLPLSLDSLLGTAVIKGKTVTYYGSEEDRVRDFPGTAVRGSPLAHARMAVPLLREGIAIGAFLVTRLKETPFSEREKALVQTFADQAVIAMENARLFDELQQRNREQAEALEREQATAEVLRVISRSPEDLDVALQAVADTAARLCRADLARVMLRDGDFLIRGPSALRGNATEVRQPGTRLAMADSKSPASHAVLTAKTVHTNDMVAYLRAHGATDAEIMGSEPNQLGVLLAIPLLRGREAVGALLLVRRQEAGPFSDREVAFAELFADQAAIAVENARLFQSIQERNRELTEALEQQTATSDVLGIISEAPADLQRVLDALVTNAARLCEAFDSTIFTLENNQVYFAAAHNYELGGNQPRLISPEFIPDRAALERRTIHVVGECVVLESEYPGSIAYVRQRLGWERLAQLVVPLMREGECIGGFVLRRPDARPFTAKQIGLVQTFADQAVIAMENARLFDELQERNREQAEALEREQATAEVLRVISRSPENLDASLQAAAVTAARLCRADVARILLRDGDYLLYGLTGRPSGADDPSEHTVQPGDRLGPIAFLHTPSADAALTGQTVHTPDRQRYYEEHGASAQAMERLAEDQRRTGPSAMLAVPMLRGAEAVGVLNLFRHGAAQHFSDREIALAEVFADQAAIAVENARLFRSIQDRNRELTEALEQQTATADVLRVISEAPTDLQRVLDTLAANSARLLGGDVGRIYRIQGDALWSEAVFSGDPAEPAPVITSIPLTRGNMGGRAVLDARVTTFYGTSEERLAEFPDTALQAARAPGVSAGISVPLMRQGRPIGMFFVRRMGEQPYSDREITLLRTFADQAVIAMDNARLFDELQQRNREQAEALEREQATAEVLRVISRSPEDLNASLLAVAEAAAKLCRADRGRVFLRDGDYLVRGPSARVDHTDGAWEAGERRSISTLQNPTVEAVRSGRAVHAPDVLAYLVEHGATAEEREYQSDGIRRGAGRTQLAVPLLRGAEAVGVLAIARREVQPFTESEIALAQTFADQAAIAVENARLFQSIQERNRELTEALEQQTATADVLRIISRSPVELQTVLDTLVENAVRLCDGDIGNMWRADGEMLRLGAYFSLDGGARTYSVDDVHIDRGSMIGTAALEQSVVSHYGAPEERFRDFPNAPTIGPERIHARLAVPLMREGESVGVFILTRREERVFSEREIALVRTFADQAVIAMENARLFAELEGRTQELEAASRAKSEFLSRMSHELRTPLNAIIGFGEIMEMDPATTTRQHDRVHHILQGGRHLLGLINEVLDITRIEAGRLSLSPEAVQLDGIVEEVLDLERPLAAEAEVRLDLEDPDAFRVAVQADRQRLRQIVLNLVANAVKYNRRGGSVTLSVDANSRQSAVGSRETVERQQAMGEAGVPLTSTGERRGEDSVGAQFIAPAGADVPAVPPSRAGEPTALPGVDARVRISVNDTGPGIAPEEIGRLFAPFERLSAEVTGVEGTGLGLAIARGLAEAMGGAIGVESVVGEGSTFWVELPRTELPVVGFPGGGVQDSARQDAGDAPPIVATVLYIEDNQPNVDLVQEALKFRPGITLLTAPDGATGIRIARRYQPALILLDLNLPELQGDEVLTRLRADDRTSAIPVVMVSADATQGQIDRLLAAGARDYLTKPLDVKRLLAIVDELSTNAPLSGAVPPSAEAQEQA